MLFPHILARLMLAIMLLVFSAMLVSVLKFHRYAEPNSRRRENKLTDIALTLLMIVITVLLASPAISLVVS